MFVGIGDGVPDRRQSVLVVCTATLVIATLFITARLVSRVVIVRRVTWDDYCIVLGWVSSFEVLRMDRLSEMQCALTVL